MRKNPKLSIIIPAHNNEITLNSCINSIMNQKYKNFELIIVDDFSSDKSREILMKLRNKKIKLIFNKTKLGSGASRNKGINIAKGDFIFFTDADCIADKNWLLEGLRTFRKKECLGVEGAVYYVSKNYIPTALENYVRNDRGGQFMTGSIAYKKSVLIKLKGFNPSLKRMQDRDLALRVKKLGEIAFNKEMKVYHQKVYWTFKKLMMVCREYPKTRVYLFKKYNDRSEIYFKIYRPLHLLIFLFPPLIFFSFFKFRYRSIKDLKMLFFLYPAVFIERISFWKSCYKNKIFLI